MVAAARAAPWLWRCWFQNEVEFSRRVHIPVTASNNGCTGAGSVCELEKTRHLGDGGTAGAVRKGVVAKGSCVAAAHTLNPDVAAAKLTLEA